MVIRGKKKKEKKKTCHKCVTSHLLCHTVDTLEVVHGVTKSSDFVYARVTPHLYPIYLNFRKEIHFRSQ